jgi:hypothetical protein
MALLNKRAQSEAGLDHDDEAVRWVQSKFYAVAPQGPARMTSGSWKPTEEEQRHYLRPQDGSPQPIRDGTYRITGHDFLLTFARGLLVEVIKLQLSAGLSIDVFGGRHVHVIPDRSGLLPN